MPDAIKKPLNTIIARSLITAEALMSELRVELVNAVLRGEDYQALLQTFEQVSIQMQVDATMAAFVEGNRAVAAKLPKRIIDLFFGGASGDAAGVAEATGSILTPLLAGPNETPLIRFPLIETAAETLLEKNIVSKRQFVEMEASARREAFAVAKLDTEDAIKTVRDVLAEQVREGPSLRSFRDELEERLGSSRLGSAHLENVYRTNIQSVYHDAHDKLANDPIVQDVFPYQSYIAVHDDRAREEHRELERLGIDGTNVYRRDDPFWDLFRPPWGYQCRCGVTLLTREAAARKGVKEAQHWIDTGRKPILVSRLDAIPFRPDPDWSGSLAELTVL